MTSQEVLTNKYPVSFLEEEYVIHSLRGIPEIYNQEDGTDYINSTIEVIHEGNSNKLPLYTVAVMYCPKNPLLEGYTFSLSFTSLQAIISKNE